MFLHHRRHQLPFELLPLTTAALVPRLGALPVVVDSGFLWQAEAGAGGRLHFQLLADVKGTDDDGVAVLRQHFYGHPPSAIEIGRIEPVRLGVSGTVHQWLVLMVTILF